LSNAALATEVTSDLPILSERSMYWTQYPNWYEEHNAGLQIDVGRSEGRVGGACFRSRAHAAREEDVKYRFVIDCAGFHA
jgi:hypothetical protein